VFPSRKCYTEQMFVFIRVQLRNHADAQTVKRGERAMQYISEIEFGMLQVRENEISPGRWSGGTLEFSQLRIFEVTAVSLFFVTKYQVVGKMVAVPWEESSTVVTGCVGHKQRNNKPPT